MTGFLNKFLKHVFNVILKLNHDIWKKTIKYIFCEKNEKRGPNQWFCSREKSPKSLKKDFLLKKFLSAYLCRYDLQNRVRNFFKINTSRDIYVPVISRFRKIVLHNKIINKTRSTKIKKIPHTILETIISRIISWSFCKIRFNAEEMELLEFAHVTTFF